MERLRDEGQVLIAAGTVSTARTLGFISFFVTVNGLTRDRVNRKSKDVMTQYLKLEKPGYPVIKRRYDNCSVPKKRSPTRFDDIIRRGFNYGVMHRLSWCFPDDPMR